MNYASNIICFLFTRGGGITDTAEYAPHLDLYFKVIAQLFCLARTHSLVDCMHAGKYVPKYHFDIIKLKYLSRQICYGIIY